MNSFVTQLSPPSTSAAMSPVQSFPPTVALNPREVLVQATIDAAANIALVDSYQVKLEEEYQTRRLTINNLHEELLRSRARTTMLETEIAKIVNHLLQLESRYIEASEASQRSNYALNKQIEFLKSIGTDADRAAIDALFYRVIKKDGSAPFVMPTAEVSVPLRELLHETYMLKTGLGQRAIPEHCLVDVVDAFSMTDDIQQNDFGYAKIARVFRRTSKADVFQFLYANTKLQQQGKAASIFGVVARYTMHSIPFHLQHLVVLCWFGRGDSEASEFPATRGETFQITLIGTDYGHHKEINSNSQSTPVNANIMSVLKNYADQFGIEQPTSSLSSFRSASTNEPATLSIKANWKNISWLRRLPLEFADRNTHSENCCIECIPVAVRVKFGSRSESNQKLAEVFSVMCLHEPTGQIFWQPFDRNNIAALKKNGDNQVDIACCSCAGAFSKKLCETRELMSSSRLSDTSPLMGLKESGMIDKETLDHYAVLQSVMHNSNMDPSTILTTSREKGNATRFVADSLPPIGHSVVVDDRTSDNSRKRPKNPVYEDNDDDDNDTVEQQQLLRPKKQKKSAAQSPAAPVKLVAMNEKGVPKKQSSCTICGVNGVKQTTHFQPNHGYRHILPQNELKKWHESLSVEDRAKFIKVAE